MRILHLISYPLYSGALPTTLALAQAQQRLGHCVWLAHDSLRGNFDGFEEAATTQLAAAALPRPAPLGLSPAATPWQTGADLWRLRQFCRRQRPDVVHCHLSHDHLLMRLLQTPAGASRWRLVRTFHSRRALQPRFGQAWLLRATAGCIVRCQAHRQRLLRQPSVGVIPASLALQRFVTRVSSVPVAAARAQWGLPPAARLLGQVALLAERGQAELLRAVARLPAGTPPLHVVLAGAGTQAAGLRRLAEQLHLTQRVHFTGYVPDALLPRFYRALDAAFVGLPGNDAGMRGALEAAASGVPLLGLTGESALADWLTPQRGYPIASCLASGFIDALGAALTHWQADAAAAARRAAAAQAYVLAQTPQREATATLHFYRSLLHEA